MPFSEFSRPRVLYGLAIALIALCVVFPRKHPMPTEPYSEESRLRSLSARGIEVRTARPASPSAIGGSDSGNSGGDGSGGDGSGGSGGDGTGDPDNPLPGDQLNEVWVVTRLYCEACGESGSDSGDGTCSECGCRITARRAKLKLPNGLLFTVSDVECEPCVSDAVCDDGSDSNSGSDSGSGGDSGGDSGGSVPGGGSCSECPDEMPPAYLVSGDFSNGSPSCSNCGDIDGARAAKESACVYVFSVAVDCDPGGGSITFTETYIECTINGVDWGRVYRKTRTAGDVCNAAHTLSAVSPAAGPLCDMPDEITILPSA